MKHVRKWSFHYWSSLSQEKHLQKTRSTNADIFLFSTFCCPPSTPTENESGWLVFVSDAGTMAVAPFLNQLRVCGRSYLQFISVLQEMPPPSRTAITCGDKTWPSLEYWSPFPSCENRRRHWKNYFTLSWSKLRAQITEINLYAYKVENISKARTDMESSNK